MSWTFTLEKNLLMLVILDNPKSKMWPADNQDLISNNGCRRNIGKSSTANIHEINAIYIWFASTKRCGVTWSWLEKGACSEKERLEYKSDHSVKQIKWCLEQQGAINSHSHFLLGKGNPEFFYFSQIHLLEGPGSMFP